MIKRVILAEKPAQARSYVDALGGFEQKQGYFQNKQTQTNITYGFGHLVELVEANHYDDRYKKWQLEDLPILPDSFKFTIPENKKSQFKVIKRLLDKTDEIIIATDCDREGENIA